MCHTNQSFPSLANQLQQKQIELHEHANTVRSYNLQEGEKLRPFIQSDFHLF